MSEKELNAKTNCCPVCGPERTGRASQKAAFGQLF